MNPFGVRNLGGLGTRRATVAGALIATALSGNAIGAPDASYSGRVCYMGDWISVWVEWTFTDMAGNYDPITHTGEVTYTVNGGHNPNDFEFQYVDNTGSLRVLTGPLDMAMGTIDVQGGLGTAQCAVSFPNIWLTVGSYGIHYVPNPGAVLAADMQLTGFTDDGQGVYLAQGLAIPVEFEVHQPDGTTVIATDTLHTLEFRTPLDLSPPCQADCDGNGVLNVDDIDCFVSSFLSGCV